MKIDIGLVMSIFVTIFVGSILFFVVFDEFIGVEEGIMDITILDIKYAGGGFLNPQKTILFTNSSSFIFMKIVAIDTNRPVRLHYSYHPNGEYYRLIDYEYIVV